AYVQQLRDGIDNFFVTFIEVLRDPTDIAAVDGEHPADFLSGFLQGTRTALLEGGRQSLTITIESFNERSLGALIALFERAVGLYGELVNINAYHQPGVEAGKKAAAQILSLQERLEAALADGQPRTVAALRESLGEQSPEALFWILRHLCANQRGYSAEGDWGHPEQLVFRKL
ncbi:MAG: glucose-6-phosphate isomerase, partial [Prochlorococcaceae cyanobacterium]